MTSDGPDPQESRRILERMVSEQPTRLPRKMRAAGYGHTEADDLAQETLLRAVRSLDGIRGPADEALVCGWVDRIATNLVRNQRRDLARRPSTRSLDPTDAGPPADHADPADDTTCRAALQSLVGILPPEQREVFIARVLQELSTKQVAETMGITEDLVRWRLRRARERLRAQVDTIA